MVGSFLKKEVENKPLGYARFEIILDNSGQAIDAHILEVNPGFEKYFGMTMKSLKDITKFQLFESFYKGNEDFWLQKYYDVAINGNDFVEIVDFDKNTSFELSAYSPIKGQFVTLFQNISNRKNNDLLYHDILTNMSESVFITGYDGHFKLICPSASNVFGLSDEELKAIHSINELIGLDPQDLLNYVNEAKDEIVLKDFIHSIKGECGTVRHVSINVKKINYSDDDLLFVCRDATDHLQTTNALTFEKKKLRSIINTIPDLVWIKDKEGSYLLCNKEFEKLYGVQEEELIGRNDHEFVSDDQVESFRKHDLLAIKNTETIKSEEVLQYKSNNQRVEVETTKTPFYDSNNDLIGVLGVARDITERKSQARELAEKNRMLAEAQRIAKIGSWYLNVLEDKLVWTDEVFRIFEEVPQSFEGTLKSFSSFIHPDEKEKVLQHFNECVAKRKPYNITHRIVSKSGKIKFVEQKASFDFDYENKMVIAHGTVQDVTASHKYQNKLGLQIHKLQMALSSGKLTAFETDLDSGEIELLRNEDDRDSNNFPIEYLENLEIFLKSIRKEQRNSVTKKIAKIKIKESDRITSDFQIYHKGEYIWYRIVMSSLETKLGEKQRLFGIIKQIEEEVSQVEIELLAQEMERLRISRDIHDSIGQMLVGTRLMLKTQIVNEEYCHQEIDEMLDEMIKESRLIINNFSTKVNVNNSFKETFQDLANKMSRVYKGDIVINWEGHQQLISLREMTNIFRIYQEALTNAIKYSQADQIKINVKSYNYFLMDVMDNGKGFNPDTASEGYGIQNMRSRAESIDADLEIESIIGEKTIVRFRLNA